MYFFILSHSTPFHSGFLTVPIVSKLHTKCEWFALLPTVSRHVSNAKKEWEVETRKEADAV